MTRRQHSTRRRTTVPVALAASVAAALLLPTAAAQAAPPTTRIVTDRVDASAAFDTTTVVLRAAPAAGRAAVVSARHTRPVAPGDTIDVWFDLDGDRSPDLHVVGSAFSEYRVFESDAFDDDGRDVTSRGCARLSMKGRVSRVRLTPACVEDPRSFSVAVRSSVDGAEPETDDWVPRPERLTRKVLAVVPDGVAAGEAV